MSLVKKLISHYGSKKELALEVGVSERTIYSWLKGITKPSKKHQKTMRTLSKEAKKIEAKLTPFSDSVSAVIMDGINPFIAPPSISSDGLDLIKGVFGLGLERKADEIRLINKIINQEYK